MKITRVAAEAYRLPPASPWEDATNKVSALEFIVVDIETDAGIAGTGFAYTVDIGGSAMLSLVNDYLSALVIGMDPLCYEQIWSKLQRQTRRLGIGMSSMAVAAIDIAIWDIIGKHCRQPLYRLLGGARDRIPAYISEINLNASDTTEQLAARVSRYLEQGYRDVKIKIGRDDVEEDIERIVCVQELLGPKGKLYVDLNQKWSEAEAVQKLALLDRCKLGWIEEPLLCHDIQGHRNVKRASCTPIALGESLYSRNQFLDYFREDAVDIVQADVVFVGGITEWMKIAHLAETFGKPVAPHYMMELSVHLLCGVPNGYMLENVVGGSFTELGLLERPIRIENGIGVPSELPGHGIRFDRSALARVRLDAGALAGFAGGSK